MTRPAYSALALELAASGFETPAASIGCGGAREVLRRLPDGLARCCVTSPPYWALRDYGVAGQLGLEDSPAEYVAAIVDVFREVRRVLAKDGTLWVNLGDSYASDGGSGWQGKHGARANRAHTQRTLKARTAVHGLKAKDLVGIPWRVAFALQEDGWYLRQDIVWHKPNAMPESVGDRCTKAHEYVFLFAKSRRYYFDAKAIAEPRASQDEAPVAGWASGPGAHTTIGHARDLRARPAPQFGRHVPSTKRERGDAATFRGGQYVQDAKFHNSHATARSSRGNVAPPSTTRNCRSVWTIPTEPFEEAHFATFPRRLVLPCIRAGSAPGDVVLDPFTGAGTTAVVALAEGRRFVGAELNPDYLAIAAKRLAQGVLPFDCAQAAEG